MALTYPHIDPVVLSLGPLRIHWYGLAYITGIFLGWIYLRWLCKNNRLPIKPAHIDDYVPWAALGIVVGGRLGHILFYEFAYYLEHPLETIQLWKPGMSFHGGFLGVILATYFFARSRHLSFQAVLDAVAMATPIGLFFGRLANFVNGELYGRVTNVPWAMVFPGGGPVSRHPSQLYEAVLEGALLWGILNAVMFGVKRRKGGFLAATFVFFYGIFRFMVEYVREPDVYSGFLSTFLSYGQFLSLPMIFVGLGWMLSRWQYHGSKS